jgi:hypothetical protein
MNMNEKINFIHNSKELIKYGIIRREGSQGYSEYDYVLIHIPTGKVKRFLRSSINKFDGNYDSIEFDEFIKGIYKWILSFPKSQKGVTVKRLLEYQTMLISDLI